MINKTELTSEQAAAVANFGSRILVIALGKGILNVNFTKMAEIILETMKKFFEFKDVRIDCQDPSKEVKLVEVGEKTFKLKDSATEEIPKKVESPLKQGKIKVSPSAEESFLRIIKGMIFKCWAISGPDLTLERLSEEFDDFMKNYTSDKEIFILTNEEVKEIFNAAKNQGVTASSYILGFDEVSDTPPSAKDALKKTLEEIFPGEKK